MRIGVVADATCDLPAEFYREHRIELLPVTIRLGADQRIDTRDPQQTLQFYRGELLERGADAETQALGAEQIRALFLDHIVSAYDYVFCITLTSTRSPLFENASKASFAILNDYRALRAAAGLHTPFALRVVDSRSMFSGTGVLVAEAARMVRAGAEPNAIRQRLDQLRDHICAYLIPADLHHIRTRGMHKGEHSVGLVTYAIGSMLDIKPVILCHRGETEVVAKVRGFERAVERSFAHVSAQIRAGIDTPHVCISYGGDPAEVAALPGYGELAQTAAAHGIEILSSIMSASAAVNAGAGGLAIAYGGALRPFD